MVKKVKISYKGSDTINLGTISTMCVYSEF